MARSVPAERRMNMTANTKVSMEYSVLDSVFVDGIGVSISVPVLCAVDFSQNMVFSRFF